MSSSDEEEESSIDSPHTGALDAAKKKRQQQERRQSPRFQQQQPRQPTSSTAKRALPLTKAAIKAGSKRVKGGTTKSGKPPLPKKRKGASKVKEEIEEIPKIKQARYSPLEDLCLAKAWISASEDPVVGANRKGTDYWQAVKTKFDIIYELEAEVMQMYDYKSLQNRWMRHINKDVQLFLKYWKAATESPPSGTTESDWLETASDNFLQELGSPFRFVECFRVLKESPKFSVDSNATAQVLANEEGRNNTEIAMGGGLQRPIGNKAAKKLRASSPASLTASDSNSVQVMAEAHQAMARAFILKDDRKMWVSMAQLCVQMGDTAGAKMWMDKLAQSRHVLPTGLPQQQQPSLTSAFASVPPSVPPSSIDVNDVDDEMPAIDSTNSGTKTTGLDESCDGGN